MSCRALLVAGLVAAGPAAARADGLDLEVATALKSSLLVSRAPDAPLLFPERDTSVALWRLRLAPELRVGEHVTMSAAYEQRVRPGPQDGTLGLTVLPSEAPAPYRVTQLDWQIGSGSAYAWRHEVDRLAVAVQAGRLELTAGRQAVGWGRGVLFSAIDLFAPLSPLEADREWRRGVDAVRAEVAVSDTISADAMAAIGTSLDESAFAGRVRGYRGDVDLELVAGWRARDLMLGVTTSAAIRDAEVHGELAAFRTPEPPPADAQLGQRGVVKAVVGGSYQIAIGNGVPVFIEYHYSGFGAVRARDVVALLGEPAFRARLERGDTQILGRHAVTAYATYELGPELATGLRCIVSPRDGSGVLVPTATATLGDRLAVTAALYVPWGAAPVDTTLRSEYGSAGLTGFVQLVATY